MEETKAQFRIGGIYRQRDGVIAELRNPPEGQLERVGLTGRYGWAHEHKSGQVTSSGWRNLTDGCDYTISATDRSLIPGELHQVNGQWVSVDNVDAGGDADILTYRVVSEPQQATKPRDFGAIGKPETVSATPVMDALERTAAADPIAAANARMVNRDGPSRPKPEHPKAEPASTVKAPLAALLIDRPLGAQIPPNFGSAYLG